MSFDECVKFLTFELVDTSKVPVPVGGVYFTERNGNGTHVPEVNVPSYISKAIASSHS